MADFHIYEDKQAQWRWRLVEDNGRIVADSSEAYVSRANATRAAENVKDSTITAEIVEPAEPEQGEPQNG